jgi:methanogenic corrinoid protein MtbC1
MSNGISKRGGDARPLYVRSLPRATDDESGELESSPDDGQRTASRGELLATIHEQILPHLLRAHAVRASEGRVASGLPCAAPTLDEVTECARLAVASDLATTLRFIESLTMRGISVESIFLDVIATASQMLGDDWDQDRRSFTDVTVGLGTLQQIVGLLGPGFSPPKSQRGFVVLVAVPGEQHTLGLFILGEFLRRAGWGVHVAPTMTESELIALVQAEKVDLVGITVSNTNLLKPLAKLVGAVKKATLNPSMRVLLGGSLELSGVAPQVGATFCADPREAVRWLEHHGDVSTSAATC